MINKILLIIFLSINILYSCAYGMENSTKLIKLPKELLNTNDPKFSPENYGKTWIILPSGNNIPKIAYLSEAPTRKFIFSQQSSIIYYLYTRENPEPININKNYELLSNDKLIKIIIHGWYSNYASAAVQSIKDAYLSVEDCYVIAADWSELSKNPFYFTAASDTRVVAKELSKFIDTLVVNRNIDTKNIHIIGHSLGAHVSGFTAKHVNSGKISRITGLDPAMPGFENEESTNRLAASDAEFVDIYHTSSILGILASIGTVDIYINGGVSPQPGCEGFLEMFNICSHSRAYFYFAESIKSNTGFYGSKCDANFTYGSSVCDETPVILGEPISPQISGVYYLETNSEEPFAKGKY